MAADPIEITFNLGSLSLTGPEESLAPAARWLRWDERSRTFRAEGRHYGPILLALHARRIPFDDQARAFDKRLFTPHGESRPRPHQQAAFAAWVAAGRNGVVVLPTGAGKSLVARMAMVNVARDALVLVPTIELMLQWHEDLSRVFRIPIGLLGGGEKRLEPITVSTYDSAHLMMEFIGNRFGLLICDECHHLPAPTTRMAALMSIAPFRLGLTATPEREDGLEAVMIDLLGEICHRSEITELEGAYLAPYDLEHVPVQLEPDEREMYETAYAEYRGFARSQGISFRSRDGWTQFIQACARSQEGRAAFRAYHLQKRLSRASRSKLKEVWRLIRRHRHERILVFTDDNATAYTIGETFFLPVLTHLTKISERKSLLDDFRTGKTPFLVTSRVLNEGVDVPEVSVGIIVSGTGSVREHVQRLGRILRPGKGKRATLYELVADETGETFTSEKRRQHLAYQRQPTLPSC